jgi:D-3-phosphoglycerate dehydrogenase
MPGRIVVTARSMITSDVAKDYLAQSDCEVVYRPAMAGFTEDELAEACRDADGVICGAATEPFTARVIEAAPRLKAISRTGVGYDSVDIAAATRNGIAVLIVPGTNEQSVAELAFGFMLALARQLIHANDVVQQRRWDRIVGSDLWHKTLSIVGLGRIGKALARRAAGFEMRVLAVDVMHDEAFANQYGVEYVSLEQALREGDFISLHAPNLPETEKMINDSTIALMKPTAYLINTARGGLVDEEALARAVRERRLAGAALDVLRAEPPRQGSPVLEVPGIILSPHMAAFTNECIDRMCLLAAQNVVEVLKGARCRNTVNPEAYDAPHR